MHPPHPPPSARSSQSATRDTHPRAMGILHTNKPTSSGGHQDRTIQPTDPNPNRTLQHPGYTIWWAYQDRDTLTPQTSPRHPPSGRGSGSQPGGGPGSLERTIPGQTKLTLHAKSQKKPRALKMLRPPLKLGTAEHTPHDEWAAHYIIPHTTIRKKDAARITVTGLLCHSPRVYELTAPNVLITQCGHDERYTIQAEGTATTTLYTWATRGDLPHPTLHHAPSWPNPFHTADRPKKKRKHTGIHSPAHEAQHRHDERCKARSLQDDHTIPRISVHPTRVSDATHNGTITGIITDCLSPAAPRADTVWISEDRSHTRAVARLNDILPDILQHGVGPFAAHITPYGIGHSPCEHHGPPCSTLCTSPLRQPLPAPTITGNMYLGTLPGDAGIYILPNRPRVHAIPLQGLESLALGPPPAKHDTNTSQETDSYRGETGKKGPPTRSGPHHRPLHSPTTKRT